MSIYSVYTFEIQEGEKSLFYNNTSLRTIDKANTIVGNILHDGLTVVGKKKREAMPLRSINMTERNDVYSWTLCNAKEITQYEGHDKNVIESHPGSYIIVDNREDVCQILVERNGAFNSDTDKVIRFFKNSINTRLSDYSLRIVVKQKYQAGKFKELIRERIANHNDHVRKIVWEFPNPDRVKGVDASRQMKQNLEGVRLITQATNALKGKLILSGSKDEPMCVDDSKIEDMAQIIALSAQNNYSLSYHFYNSPTVYMKNVANACFTIDEKIIDDFSRGQSFVDKNGQTTYQLISVLDDIRNKISDYDNKIIDE